MKDVLTRFKVVEVLGKLRQAGTEVQVDWRNCANRPPLSWMKLGLEQRPAAGEQVLAMQGEPRSDLTYVARWKHFPLSLDTQVDARGQFKSELEERQFNDGIIDGPEWDQLEALLRNFDLSEKDVQPEIFAVWGVLDELCKWAESERASEPSSADTGAPASLARAFPVDLLPALPKSLVDLAPAELLAKAHSYLSAHEQAVLQALEDLPSRSAKSTALAEATRLPQALVERVLLRLKSSGRVSDIGSDVWRIYEGALVKRLKETLDNLRNDRCASNETPLPEYVWELASVAVEFLERMDGSATATGELVAFSANLREEFGRPAGPADHRTNGVADVAGAQEANSGSDQASDSQEMRQELTIDGKAVPGRGLTTWVRELDKMGVWRDVGDNLLLSLPHIVGRTRYLAAKTPKHKPRTEGEEGTDFGYPTEVRLDDGQIVYFEGNFPKAEAVYYLAKLLDACGVAKVEVTHARESSSEQGADEALENEDVSKSRTMRVQLSASADDSDEDSVSVSPVEFKAKSVRDLLDQVIPYLFERRANEMEMEVPRALGRTRFLIHTAPVHPSGTPFRSPHRISVEKPESNVGVPESSAGKRSPKQDFYIETHLSRDLVVRELTSLCAAVGFECTSDVDDEGEPGEELEGQSTSDEGVEEAPAGSSIELSVLLPDGTVANGRTAKKFFLAVLDGLARQDMLKYVPRPFLLPSSGSRRSTRHLLAHSPKHSKGAEFQSSLEYPWEWEGGDKIYLELNLMRDVALGAMQALVSEVELRARAQGTASTSNASLQSLPGAESFAAIKP
jgi:hypothetical protein